MSDQNSVLNDPNFVPFITHDGSLLRTHVNQDERILIVSSSLATRFTDATQDDNRNWLRTPIRQMRGK